MLEQIYELANMYNALVLLLGHEAKSSQSDHCFETLVLPLPAEDETFLSMFKI